MMPLDPHDDAVAMQRLFDIGRRDVNVALEILDFPLRRHEPKARRVCFEASDNEVHAVSDAISRAAHQHERAFVDERLEVSREGGAFLARDVQDANQLSGSGGVMDLFTNLTQELVA